MAWSWMGFRPSNEVARGVGSGSGVERKWLPSPTEVEFEVDETEVNAVGQKVSQEIKKLERVLWKFDQQKGMGMFMSREGDVWSRKARRKKTAQDHGQEKPRRTEGHVNGSDNGAKPEQKEDAVMKDQRDSEDEDSSEEDEAEPALVARISIKPVAADSGTSARTMVHIRHLQGQDSVLFESFCGWLKRKITPPL